MEVAQYALIGGTGVYDAESLLDAHDVDVDTPYGTTICTVGAYHEKSVAFMPRHGKDHHVAPHQVNYKANIWALKELGVTQIFATAAVGSLRLALPPGALVIVDQFLDFTKARSLTYFENGNQVTHTDMSDPYCGRLRNHLHRIAQGKNIAITNGATYVCAEGPRFETPAEIRFYSQIGGDVVGMTTVPEVVLAKELGLCYATVAMVTNFAAGMTGQPISHEEVLAVMADNVHKMRDLFFATIDALDTRVSCACRSETR